MKRLVATALASVATLGLLSACGDSKSELASHRAPSSRTPRCPRGNHGARGHAPLIGCRWHLPEATIDLMIAQFEANGLKVDKACFTALLSDESMRKLVEASRVERRHQR